MIFVAWVLFLIMPKPARQEYFYLGAFLTAIFANECITAIGFFVFHLNMNPVVNVSSLFYYTFIILFYKDKTPIRNVNAIGLTIVGLFLALASVNIFFINSITTYDSYTWAASNVCVV